MACARRCVTTSILFLLLLSGELRLSCGSSLHATAPTAEVAKVLDMMKALLKEIDAEQAADEESFAAFTGWCAKKKDELSQSIEELNTRLGELEASLSALYAQKDTLAADISRLTDEITTTQGQIDVATEKRTEENTAFQQEQADFDGSIGACGRAVEILAAHYGEPAKEAERPAWMSFAEVAQAISKQVMQSKYKHALSPTVLELIEQPQSFGRYESSSGEAGTIVDEMKALAETFKGDKVSAMEDEKRLNDLFLGLMGEKNEILKNLKAERDGQQSILNTVNRDISEQESAKLNAENELKDQQKFLANNEEMCQHTRENFEMRSADRKAEREAIDAATNVLSGVAGNPAEAAASSFLQRRLTTSTKTSRRTQVSICPNCQKAAALLASASRTLHSQTLASAASSASGNEMVQEVIAQIENLEKRIDQDMQMQSQHKTWCETELSETSRKTNHHESLVDTLTQHIADSTSIIEEKKGGISDVDRAIERNDQNFQETTTIQEQEREDFDTEHKNYVDSIKALNEAVDILAKFYNSVKGASLLENSDRAHLRRQTLDPSAFEGVYEQKGGRGVVEMVQKVRGDFEKGKADLEEAEKQAHEDYQATRTTYEATRGALTEQLNRVTVELQTADASIEQFKEDKTSNEAVVTNSGAYQEKVRTSCEPLLKDFERRVETRNKEKEALKAAANLLRDQ